MSPCGRRTFLAAALRAGAGLGCVALLPLAGCNGGDTPPAAGPLRLSLADLAEGARVRREVGGVPVEIRRQDGAVIARSLLCTHQGCEVTWREGTGDYLCPCHDGRFDGDGRPLYGPPRLPLRLLPVTVTGDEVVIGA